MPALTREPKKRLSLNVPNKLSFLKTKVIRPGEPENQKENQFTNRKIYNTSDVDFGWFSEKKPRNKIFHRQVLI